MSNFDPAYLGLFWETLDESIGGLLLFPFSTHAHDTVNIAIAIRYLITLISYVMACEKALKIVCEGILFFFTEAEFWVYYYIVHGTIYK